MAEARPELQTSVSERFTHVIGYIACAQNEVQLGVVNEHLRDFILGVGSTDQVPILEQTTPPPLDLTPLKGRFALEAFRLAHTLRAFDDTAAPSDALNHYQTVQHNLTVISPAQHVDMLRASARSNIVEGRRHKPYEQTARAYRQDARRDLVLARSFGMKRGDYMLNQTRLAFAAGWQRTKSALLTTGNSLARRLGYSARRPRAGSFR